MGKYNKIRCVKFIVFAHAYLAKYLEKHDYIEKSPTDATPAARPPSELFSRLFRPLAPPRTLLEISEFQPFFLKLSKSAHT